VEVGPQHTVCFRRERPRVVENNQLAARLTLQDGTSRSGSPSWGIACNALRRFAGDPARRTSLRNPASRSNTTPTLVRRSSRRMDGKAAAAPEGMR
jgi:hypothetical protein